MTGSDDTLKVVEEFIDAVIGSARFVVSGSSYGAHIARGLVHRRAASIDGLVVTVPVIVAEPSERILPPRTILARDEAVMTEARSEDMAWLSEIAVVQGRSVLANARALKGSKADEQFLQKFKRRYSFDVDSLPAPFPAPALFMMGRQDHVVGYRDAWAIIEDYPRASLLCSIEPATFSAASNLNCGRPWSTNGLIESRSGAQLVRRQERPSFRAAS
jgi:pimeloyl-ACP methyl ester carboxylesterase